MERIAFSGRILVSWEAGEEFCVRQATYGYRVFVPGHQSLQKQGGERCVSASALLT